MNYCCAKHERNSKCNKCVSAHISLPLIKLILSEGITEKLVTVTEDSSVTLHLGVGLVLSSIMIDSKGSDLWSNHDSVTSIAGPVLNSNEEDLESTLSLGGSDGSQTNHIMLL